MAKKKKKPKLTAWQKHVKAYMADHPGLSFKEALPKAKLTYKPGKAAPKEREPTKRRKRKMAKKKTKRRKRKFSILSAVALGGHLFGTTGVGTPDSPLAYASKGDFKNAAEAYIRNLTGYGWWGGVWKFEWLARGWAPTLIALGMKKIVGWLGLNRYLRDLPFNL